MAKFALLIGVSEYEPGFSPIPSSVLDVEELRRVLVHPDMGGFAEADVTTLKNPQRQEMEDAIYRLFVDRKKDDLLLLYFSGHGIKDEIGRLYLATRTTRKENGRLVNPSAVAATYLHERISESKSQHQVIILDCCFSGAIAQGMTVKDDGSVDIQAILGRRGRAILTSSNSVEYSLGSDGSSYADNGLSVYTRFLVEGIETGAADIDGDGRISAEELHEYASRQVKTVSPGMTPKFYPVEEGYKIILAKSPQDDPRLKYRKAVQERAKQGQGKFSVFAQRILEDKRREWGLSPAEAEAIQTEVLQPYREYEQKLQDYEQALREAATHEYPFSRQTELDLQEYRQHLNLKPEDWQAIETRILTPFAQQSEKTEFNPIPVKASTSSPPAQQSGKGRIAGEKIGLDLDAMLREPPKAAEDDLNSEKGINYTRLRDLLKAQKWEEADQETADLMLRAMEKQPWWTVEKNDLSNFPCTDLKTIDSLWVKYSNGHFGFSVQKQIYVECGAKLDGKNLDDIWRIFGNRVGWRKGSTDDDGTWLSYNELTASSSPKGFFPVCVPLGLPIRPGRRFDSIAYAALSCEGLFSRIKACGL